MGQRFHEIVSPYVYLSSNLISRLGVVMVTTATVLWIYLLPTFFSGSIKHPYAGILIFVGLPAVFLGGLALIPVGIVLRRRAERKRGVYPTSFVPIDARNPEFRRLMLFIGVITVINVLIGGQLVYSSVNYMDGVTFCGKTCHTVMQPEYVAYEHSPHARVACVQCHIGPGASWFVRSKLSGVHQVFAVTFDTYDRPIPVPVSNLRPARETCEQCHWPARFEGNRLVVIPHYADDEANTVTQTVLLMHVGGGDGHGGIHGAHVGPGITIRYGSDEKRQNIHWVEYGNAQTGQKTLFVSSDTKPETVRPETGRIMDCIDCHNQPTHIFHLPGKALDQSMARGEISASLPYVKKEGVELLQQKYSSQQQAAEQIPGALERVYQQKYPAILAQRRADVDRAANAIVGIYRQNVFPEMKVTWGTYPNNLGHVDFPGCFRCHGTLQSSRDPSNVLTQDCNTCHSVLAVDEANPKVLSDLGLTPTSGQPSP